MTAEEILGQVEVLGGRLWLEGDRLKYRIPEQAFSPDLLSTLKEHKPELMQILIDKQPTPRIDQSGGLIIPFNADPKFFWWAGGQTVRKTREELQRNMVN